MSTEAKLVGQRIKIIRITKHLQQTEVAKRVGVSQAHLSNIESGRSNVTLENLLKLQEVLECSVSSFFTDVDNKTKIKPQEQCFSMEDFASALLFLKQKSVV